MKANSLKDIFDAFNALKVLIIGDVMIDSYVYGKVERISPEAPVPVITVSHKEKRLGGAANVALNVQALGATPLLCSVIGEDEDGHTFKQLLNDQQISCEGIIQSKNRITTEKQRIMSSAHHLLRVDSEISTVLNQEEEKALIDRISSMIPEVDVIIFEDYDKGAITPFLIQEVVTIANKQGTPSVVDPKKRNFLDYHGVTLFKPNLKELKEGLKIEFDVRDIAQLKNAVEILKSKVAIKNALITLSERGVYIDCEKEQHLIPAHIRTISDVSGAGDTVISIAALCMALNLPPKLVATLSNLGGGLVCEFIGVVPINKNSLFEEALAHKLFEQHVFQKA